MPTAPSNSRYLDEEEDDDLTPLPAPVRPSQRAPQPATPAPAIPAAPEPTGTPGAMDAPDPTVRRATTKVQLGIAPSQNELGRVVERQRLETAAPEPGGEGMDAPDRATRIAAMKAQLGMRPSDKEINRLNERQRLESQGQQRNPSQGVSKLLEGSVLDPRGTRQEQAMQARRDQIEATRQRNTATKEEQKGRNAKLEQEMRGTGQQFYTDPYGDIQPVIEEGTNRALYHPTLWEDGGAHPKTGEPTMVKRDKYGQRQYRTPPLTSGADPTDDQLYYKFADDDLRPAGSMVDLAKNPNPKIARMALSANRRRIEATHKQALAPIKALSDGAELEYQSAKDNIARAQGEIDDLAQQSAQLDQAAKQTAGGFLGIGAKPTPEAQAAISQKAALDDEIQRRTLGMTALQTDTGTGGKLARQRTMAKIGLHLASAAAVRDTYAAQEEEIVARIKDEGGSPETDPVYIANHRDLENSQRVIQQAEAEQARYHEAFTALAPTPAPAAPTAPQRTDVEPEGPFTGDPNATNAAPAAARSFAQSFTSFIGSISKGAEILGYDMPPVDENGRYYDEAAGKDWERRMHQSATDKVKDIRSGPAFEFGQSIQKAAREVYPVSTEEQKQFLTKAGAMAGGFLPLLASGPASPATIGIQTLGDSLDEAYDEQVKQGKAPDEAANEAINRAMVSGTLQATIFAMLPKPLQKLADKFIIEKLAKSTATNFMATRLAQAAEGAALGTASHAAENIALGRPTTEGIGPAAAGMAAMQALMPRGGGAAVEEAPPETAPSPTRTPPPRTPEAPPTTSAPEPADLQTKLDRIAQAAEDASKMTPEQRAAAEEDLVRELSGGAENNQVTSPAPQNEERSAAPGSFADENIPTPTAEDGTARAAEVAPEAQDALVPVEANKPQSLADSPHADKPVKLEIRRTKTGEMVEVEMSARKAEERLNKHLSALERVRKCLEGVLT